MQVCTATEMLDRGTCMLSPSLHGFWPNNGALIFFFNKSRRCDSNGQPCHHSCKIEIDPVAFLSISPVPSCFVDLFVSSRWAWSGETGTLQTPIQGMLLWSTPLYSLSENLGDSCSFHLILSRPLGACAPRLLDYFFLLGSLHPITVA